MELKLARLGIAVLALLVTADMQGALFSARDWKLDSEVSAGAGHDSNLFFVNNGVSSGYYTAQTTFKASRKGGRSGLDLTGSLTGIAFDEDSVKDQLDYSAGARYEYSKGIDRPSAFADLRYNNTRTANSSVGQRVELEDWRLSTGVDVANTGVGLINVGFDASNRRYVGRQFDTNRRYAVNGNVTLNPSSLLRYAVGAYAGTGESDPNDNLRDSRKSRFVGITGRLDGQLTAAIRGTLFVGAQYVQLRSGMNDERLVPVAGGVLSWNPSINQTVRASVDMGESFAADGSWTEYQRIRLAFEQRLLRSYLATVQITPARSKFVRTTSTRDDEEIGAGVSLAYVPSERFRVTGMFEYTKQESNEARYDFDRRHYSVAASFRW